MSIRALKGFVFVLIALCAAHSGAALADTDHFVRPAELEPDIAFWRRIYTEVTTEGGLLHDPEDLGIVYEAVRFPSDLGPKQRSKRIDDAKRRYGRILEKLPRA